jgi:hypothetical protein
MVSMLELIPSPEADRLESCDIANATKILSGANEQFWQSGLSFPDWITKWSKNICVPVVTNQTTPQDLETKISQLLMEPIVFLFNVRPFLHYSSSNFL